jgi:recombination protein RecA
MFGKGIDKLGDLINVATDLEIVQKSGSWYSYGEVRLGQGKEKSADFLEENPQMIDEIRTRVMNEIQGVTGAGDDFELDGQEDEDVFEEL